MFSCSRSSVTVVLRANGHDRELHWNDGMFHLRGAPEALPLSSPVPHAYLSQDGVMYLSGLHHSKLTPAAFIADIFHEWAHIRQYRRGWRFVDVTQPCRFMIQEGEARATEIWLARKAATMPRYHQKLTNPIDYGAMADNLMRSVEHDIKQHDHPVARAYAKGAQIWANSGTAPHLWALREVNACR